MPPPPSTSRYADHWVADALAADDSLDFSAVMALLDVSRESLAGAPEAVTERVALRCLQELASVTAEVGAAAPPAGVLRVDVSLSCEDLLLDILAEVRSPGNLEKDMLPAFSQDIQNIISIKKPALPETCFELLREVDPEIACIAPAFPVEQNGNNKQDDQSLCNISHRHVLTDKHMFPTDNANVDETCTGNVQKDSIGDVGLTASSPENNPSNVDENMSVPAAPTPGSCDATLKASATELLSTQDTVVHTAIVQPQPCSEKSPNPPHRSDVERLPDDGTCSQSSYGLSHEGPSMRSIVTPGFDKSCDVVPTNASEARRLPEFFTAQDTTIIPHADSSKIRISSLQHESAEKSIQDLDYDSANIRTVEKDFSHEEEELTLPAASVLPFVSCNDAVQGDKPDTKNLPGKTIEHRALFEQQNDVNDGKVNYPLFCDSQIMENYLVPDGLNVRSASAPHSCNVALHNKISGNNCFSKQNSGKNTTDVQKHDCSIAVPTDNLSCAEKMSFSSNYQDTNGSPGGCSEQDLCIKCGKDGKLLKCSSCLLAAHDSCFVSPVTFEDSGQFYCPVCFYTKASEAYQKANKTYCEARKNLAAFLGTNPLVKQHDEQLPTVLPVASHSKVHLSGYDSRQTEAHSISHRDEVPDRQRKRQKTNDTCPVELFTERASSVPYSDVETLNKPPILLNNSNKIQDAENLQEAEHTGTLEGADSGNSYNGTRSSSHNKCGSSGNQEFEADKEDALSNSSQSEKANETEATYLNYPGNQLLPPLHNTRRGKARLQKREVPVSSNSREVFVQQDQHMLSPLNYTDPTNHHSNPVEPTRRRAKQSWTEEEARALKEAMARFAPQDNGTIPWAEILKNGRNVFHSARLPCDLRVKWRNMMKKAGS